MSDKNSGGSQLAEGFQQKADERETTFEPLAFSSRGHVPFVFAEDEDGDD